MIVFDPEKHLSRSDQERLAAMAEQVGMDPAAFIEATLKRAIFSEPVFVPPSAPVMGYQKAQKGNPHES